MECPQCQSEEINSSGTCMVCGYQVPESASDAEPESPEKEIPSLSGMITMDYSDGEPESSPKEELPQWRKDLAQRLQAIKQKRDTSGAPGAQTENKVPSIPIAQTQTAVPRAAPQARIVDRALEHKPAPKPRIPAPRQKTLQPLESVPVAPKTVLKQADPQEIQKLIDNAVSKQSTVASAPVNGAEIPRSVPPLLADQEGKLILLSRTLSGLVDLICIVLSAGMFVIAADYFSGIIVLDSFSLIDFSVLLLLTYFVYSFFFLASAGQTIGMMITNLRVVGAGEKRPSLRQLLSRCCGHLVSLLGLGIGLLWSLFSRESLCLHDRLSGTHVIRC
jgi:uncharacterized RDD family membrane protein YckC